MDRRAFLTTVGVSIAATPFVGEAQETGKVWRIAILTSTPRPAPESSHYYNNLPNELRQLGYYEGRNLIIELIRVQDERIIEVRGRYSDQAALDAFWGA